MCGRTKAIKISISRAGGGAIGIARVDPAYYRGDQSSANFDNTLHAKCIDLHYARGDEKATALRVRQDTRDLDPAGMPFRLHAVGAGRVCGLFRDKLQGLRTIIFVLAQSNGAARHGARWFFRNRSPAAVGRPAGAALVKSARIERVQSSPGFDGGGGTRGPLNAARVIRKHPL